MRLLIVAPNAMLVSLLTKVLGDEDDIDIVGGITDLEDAAQYRDAAEIIAYHADVAGPALYDGIRSLREQLPGARLVLLHAPDLQDLILGAIEVGAVGYVHSHQSVAHMLTTLRTVHRHGVAIDPAFTSVLVERMAQLSQQVRSQAGMQFNHDANLTERQIEVLALIHEGMTNEEISERLYISVGTVKNHVHNILKMLDAENREQAAYWYALQQKEFVPDISPDGVTELGCTIDDDALIEAAHLPRTRRLIEERLARFCQQLEWSIGHAFLLDGETLELVSAGVWYLDDRKRYAAFVRDTSARRFTSQEDVIGNILFSPEPVWVADVGSYPGYLRAEAARQVGIQSGLILPLFDGELIGVMEFYAIKRAQPDPQVVADILISSRGLGDHIKEKADSETAPAD